MDIEMIPAIYIDWRYWGFQYTTEHSRMCESTYRHTELVIGPFSFEWDEWD